MLRDLTNSIKVSLYERVTSPLLSTFAISWLIWNYKIVLIILSSMKPEAKFNMINMLISSTKYKVDFPVLGMTNLEVFIFPLIFTTCFIFFYHLIASKYLEVWLNGQIRLKNVKNKCEEARVLTVKESRELISRTAQLELAYEEENTKLQSKVNDYKTSIEELKKSLDDIGTVGIIEPVPEPDVEHDVEVKTILPFYGLASNEEYVNASLMILETVLLNFYDHERIKSIINENFPNIKDYTLDVIIDELKTAKLISSTYNQDDGASYYSPENSLKILFSENDSNIKSYHNFLKELESNNISSLTKIENQFLKMFHRQDNSTENFTKKDGSISIYTDFLHIAKTLENKFIIEVTYNSDRITYKLRPAALDSLLKSNPIYDKSDINNQIVVLNKNIVKYPLVPAA